MTDSRSTTPGGVAGGYRLLRDDNLCLILQFVKAAGRQNVPGIYTRDLCCLPLSDAHIDVLRVGLVVLQHVRVVDGTGAPARDDQTVVIAGDKIESIGNAASVAVPRGAKVLDLNGYTVISSSTGERQLRFALKLIF